MRKAGVAGRPARGNINGQTPGSCCCRAGARKVAFFGNVKMIEAAGPAATVEAGPITHFEGLLGKNAP